jgi:hypothetical protein
MGLAVAAALVGFLAGGSLGFWIAILILQRHMQTVAEGYDVSDRIVSVGHQEAEEKDAFVWH